jgi:hypothetical protein
MIDIADRASEVGAALTIESLDGPPPPAPPTDADAPSVGTWVLATSDVAAHG